jgi:molecular chaperone HscA
MEKHTAAILLASLIERIDRDQAIGSVSSLECKALQIALRALGVEELDTLPLNILSESSSVEIETEVPGQRENTEHNKVSTAPSVPEINLVLTSIERDEITDPDVLLCLDFGTAMSKAFATAFPNKYLDLELGTTAGKNGYPLPSSVFIGDDAKIYFGYEAIEMSQGLTDSGRQRLDSIKGWLSLRREGNLDSGACVLQKAMNPTPFKLTQGDLIRIYLAYLTDISEISLVKHGLVEPRYIKRRFARPCWPDVDQTKWAESLMRKMLAEAQILADTFTGQWSGGIEVGYLKAAVEKIKELDKRPDYLIDEGIPEPVAVAAGAIANSHNRRDAFMVVDVGAGTTDFGLFISTYKPINDELRVFQIPESIRGLMQAGDKVDGLLHGFIAQRESVDPSDTAGELILADLSRRKRSLKETLFKTDKLEYILADGTIGAISLEEFLSDERVVRFGQAVEDGFKKALEEVHETWLDWLSKEGVRLHVLLTGGSSSLPMMKSLGHGVIEVKGYKILRQAVYSEPEWMDDMPNELISVYPQLAVAIGGSAETIPESLFAPPIFAGGGNSSPAYVAGRLHISGS